MEERSKKPSNYLLYPKFQIKLIGVNLFVLILFSTIVFSTVGWFVFKLRKLGIEAGLAEDHLYFGLLNQHQGTFYLLLVAAIVSTAFISTLASIILSHRVVGPIHRLKNDLDEVIRSEKVRPVQFREEDYFQEIPLKINKIIAKAYPESEFDSSSRRSS